LSKENHLLGLLVQKVGLASQPHASVDAIESPVASSTVVPVGFVGGLAVLDRHHLLGKYLGVVSV